MAVKEEYVRYASYGSNILEKRFLCYIQGGQPEGSSKINEGCRNKTLPTKKEKFSIKREMYFAKSSKTWDEGGVSFIKNNISEDYTTLARIYLITREQFEDVVKQENDSREVILIDFNTAIKKGSLIVKEVAWYGNLIFLGEKDSFPIFTFTNKENIAPYTKPSKSYIKTIIRGLKETYPELTEDEMIKYFISKSGVKDNYSETEIKEMI